MEKKNGQPIEPFPKRKKADFTTFECLLLKFPHLGKAIFDNLDDQSVAKCTEVNEMIQNSIYKYKSYWIRQTKSFFGTNNVLKSIIVPFFSFFLGEGPSILGSLKKQSANTFVFPGR